MFRPAGPVEYARPGHTLKEVAAADPENRCGGPSLERRLLPAGNPGEKLPVVGVPREGHVAARPVVEAR